MNDSKKLEEEFREKFCLIECVDGEKDATFSLELGDYDAHDIFAWFKERLDEKDERAEKLIYGREAWRKNYLEVYEQTKKLDKEIISLTSNFEDEKMRGELKDFSADNEITKLRGEIERLQIAFADTNDQNTSMQDHLETQEEELANLRKIIREMGEALKKATDCGNFSGEMWQRLQEELKQLLTRPDLKRILDDKN